MAFTEAQLVAELDAASTGRTITLQSYIPNTVYTSVYAVGVIAPYAGRSRWVDLDSTDTAANVATALRTALQA